MSEIPYTPLYGKIEEYFKKIQEIGIPTTAKVNRKWLSAIGFKGGNDSYILKVLRFIGFVDDSKTPTEVWKKYKDPMKSSAVLAQAIRTGYSGLFATYEDAHRKDREALYVFFSSKTGKSKRTVDLMVNTFVGLCKLADFEEEAPELKPPREEETIVRESIAPKRGIAPEIHINIQLHLPATNDPSIYENLFKSLRKHLLSAEE